MGVKVIRKSEVIPIRSKKTTFSAVPEWQEVREILAVGLKPYEVVEVEISPESASKFACKDPLLSLRTKLRRHCAALHLSYDMPIASSGGRRVLYIIGR